MTIHVLPAHALYILSAPPGSGKSTFLKNASIPKECIISSDGMRETILGQRPYVDADGEKRIDLHDNADRAVFEILEAMARARLAEKLPTFIDATSVTESDRNHWKKIADDYGVPTEVLIFNVDEETSIQQDNQRERKVGANVIQSFFRRFVRESALPYRTIERGDSAVLMPNLLSGYKYDIVGDSHGLMSNLKNLLAKAGWRIENSLPKHDDSERRLVFLGDFIDRGPDSLEMLRFMKRCQAVGHTVLSGNHEHKVAKALRRMLKEGQLRIPSIAGAETICNILEKCDEKERLALTDWMRNLPTYAIVEHNGVKVAFTHADIPHFNPLNTPAGDMIYGLSDFGKRDTDSEYSRGFEQGVNQHILIRGHIPCTSESVPDFVFSLDDKQAFAGRMLMLKLDGFIDGINAGKTPKASFAEQVVEEKCDFDFRSYAKKFDSLRELEKLAQDKLVTKTVDVSSGLILWKFSKSVFWDSKWGESDWLLRARGHVTDITGKVIQNPFDKIFNYGERGTGEDIPDDTRVKASLKMNGFLGCITAHPYRKGQLLVTTTGSFDSPFVDRIKDFLDPKTIGKTMKFLSKNDLTLMFEVIHPTDPHIIKYGEEDMGLWLIGARTKTFGSPLLKEEELDEIAKEIGVKRGHWFETTLGDIRERGRTEQNEGYVVRACDDAETPILKIKSTYYLITKFLGRMGDGNVRFMYTSPQKFKEKVDEEFYPLVDMIVSSIKHEDFASMDPEKRVEVVREMIDANIRSPKPVVHPAKP